MTQTSKPPTPRRCQRILQAHRLRCQGLSLSEIAREMHCARSTVAAYLRDLKLHYTHILQSVAADQLLNLIPALSEPDQEPAQHRQQIATVRELRLLLTNLPQIETALPQPEPAPEPKPAPTYHSDEMSVGQYYASLPEAAFDEQTDSDLQPPTEFGPDPDPIEPNLDYLNPNLPLPTANPPNPPKIPVPNPGSDPNTRPVGTIPAATSRPEPPSSTPTPAAPASSPTPNPAFPATAAVGDPRHDPVPLSPRKREEMPRSDRGGSGSPQPCPRKQGNRHAGLVQK